MTDAPIQTSDSLCAACRRDWPKRDHLVMAGAIADLYLHEDQFFTGWCVLVLRRHATELFELTQDERHALVDQAALVARALKAAFRARKINYELLGNQLPHIHWHLIPRRSDDPQPLEPVWRLEHEPKRMAGDELRKAIEGIQTALQALGGRC